ncbi:MAG: CinA family protein [Thiotrichaceae bacterium]|nr:CinA family protein [Thiotrichaceae bacterium]
MLESLAKTVANHLLTQNLILASAESCTGGWVAKLMTDIAGSSAWFDRGFVTYTNESKQDLLGVNSATLERYGAVSEQTVAEMVSGALIHSSANIAVAISGIAGPTGGSKEKPVGMVCFAWQQKDQFVRVSTQYFKGDRGSVREQAVVFILEKMMEC